MKQFLSKTYKKSIELLYLLSGKEISTHTPARIGTHTVTMQSQGANNAAYKLYNDKQDCQAEIHIQCLGDGSIYLAVKKYETNGKMALFTTTSERDSTLVYKGEDEIYPVAKNVSFGRHLCPNDRPTRNIATLKSVFVSHGIPL